MREIKFRAWDKTKKQMLEIRELTFLVDDGNPMCIEAWEPDAKEKSSAYLITLAPETFALMQFTGLKDKNGKEIWEGDVLKVRDPHNQFTNFAVIWRSGAWHVEATRDTRYLKTVVPDSNVIGNIYENPELLNEKTKG